MLSVCSVVKSFGKPTRLATPADEVHALKPYAILGLIFHKPNIVMGVSYAEKYCIDPNRARQNWDR